MEFVGSMVALATPMGDSGEVDYGALERLVEFHVESGTDAVVVTGTTGEAPTLLPAEIEEITRQAVAAAAGRIPVVGGAGANATRTACDLAARVGRAGADGALVVTPYYNRPEQDGLFQHYRSVADAAGVPVILYNVPGRTGCDLLPETAARLAEVDGIAAIKEATPGTGRLAELQAVCPDGFGLLSGDDFTCLEFLLAGGHGFISVSANVAPRLMREMYTAAAAGDAATARDIDARLQVLHKGLFCASSPIPTKWALEQMGLIGPGIRLPMTGLAEAHHGTVLEALAAAGIKPARGGLQQ